MKISVKIQQQRKQLKVAYFINIKACPKQQFYSWWNLTPLNKYWLASILGVVGILFLILGNHFFNILLSIIIATGGAIFIKGIVSPFYLMHIYSKFLLLIRSCFGYRSCISYCCLLLYFNSTIYFRWINRIYNRKLFIHYSSCLVPNY